MSYSLGPNDHTAAFRTGTHADIAASIAASEPPSDPPKVIDGGYNWGTRNFGHQAPQDDRPVRGPRKPA